MTNSKALKPSSYLERLNERSHFRKKLEEYYFYQKASHYIRHYFWYPIVDAYHRYNERIRRSYSFAKHAWLHYDFESAYLYDIMAFKLKRIKRTLENGCAIQEKKDMAALDEAIKICTRLFKGDYEWKYHRKHDKKWGSIRTKTIPNYDDQGKITTYQWKTSRSKVNPKNEKQERKEFLNCWVMGNKDREKDIDRLAEIFKKHEPAWWD